MVLIPGVLPRHPGVGDTRPHPFRPVPLALERGLRKVLDARELPFESGSFDAVISKGTVDALMCDDTSREQAR